MKKDVSMSGGRCSCGPANFGWMLLAAVLFAAGLWMLAYGLCAQWNMKLDWFPTLLWYAGGFFVMMFGKACKWKAMNCAHCFG